MTPWDDRNVALRWSGQLLCGAAMVMWSGAGAEDAALGLLDRDVVDAGLAAAHQAVLVELPQLVAVAAPPAARGVVAFVLEPDRDPVPVEGPQVLAQRVVELAVPLGREE